MDADDLYALLHAGIDPDDDDEDADIDRAPFGIGEKITFGLPPVNHRAAEIIQFPDGARKRRLKDG